MHTFLRSRRWWMLMLGALLVLGGGCTLTPRATALRAELWNWTALTKVPAVTWGVTNGLVQELYYEGEPFQGKPTRIFAYIGRPAAVAGGPKRHPGMILVHGGGGKAFAAWAEHWAKRGYVAIAMDLAGTGPAGRLPDGGPDQADQVKFRNFTEAEAKEMWTYHAVTAVIRAHSLLRSLTDVDTTRTGLAGISWGGYLTCIVAGLDGRFKVAVPVYGCGFLGDNSVWKDGALAKMKPEARELWLELFDPSAYLGRVRRPILFVNGTTDFAYPLDSYQKSYRLVPAAVRNVSVTVNRPHGHIWTFPEVDAFVDGALGLKPPLVRVGRPEVEHGRLSVRLDNVTGLKDLSLCYTTNAGPWQKRTWQTAPARLEGQQLVGDLPGTRPLVAFLALKDERGNALSSEHVEWPDAR